MRSTLLVEIIFVDGSGLSGVDTVVLAIVKSSSIVIIMNNQYIILVACLNMRPKRVIPVGLERPGESRNDVPLSGDLCTPWTTIREVPEHGHSCFIRSDAFVRYLWVGVTK